MLPILLIAFLQVGVDTVRVDVATALERGVQVAPALEASRFDVEAASRRAVQASPWPNPMLGVSVENLGQSESFTGIPGAEGLEGQAVLTVPLPFGNERSGAIRRAEAEARLAEASSDVTTLQVRAALLVAMGAVLRDQVLTESAREEAEALRSIADALDLQASAGRAADGDAARARLAAGMAWTRLARREGAFALGSAELGRRLGYAPGTVVVLEAPACEPGTGTPTAGGAMAPTSSPASDEDAAQRPPELRVAEARVEAARGATDVSRGIRMPDFAPQVGVRRSGGNTGLYVGVATRVPIFDRGSERIGASVAEENRAIAEQRDVEERWAAASVGARNVLESLERAGGYFDEAWEASLERTVTAAEARYRLGEGTLVELLDGRRARLQALDDHAVWMYEWWAARVEVRRLAGQAATPSLICRDLTGVTR